jgi:hypothetical protein
LSKAAQSALDAIKNEGYEGALNLLPAEEIIDLGLAIYGYGDHIKALFAPNGG